MQELNRQPVRTAQEFARGVGQAANQNLVMLLNRGGNPAYVVIEAM